MQRLSFVDKFHFVIGFPEPWPIFVLLYYAISGSQIRELYSLEEFIFRIHWVQKIPDLDSRFDSCRVHTCLSCARHWLETRRLEIREEKWRHNIKRDVKISTLHIGQARFKRSGFRLARVGLHRGGWVTTVGSGAFRFCCRSSFSPFARFYCFCCYVIFVHPPTVAR